MPNTSRFSTNSLLCLVLALLGAGFCLLWLLSRGPQFEEISFVESGQSAPVPRPVEISRSPSHSFVFDIEIPSDRDPHALEILLGTFEQPSVVIKSAEAVSLDGACRYASQPGTVLLNNNHLRLTKVSCSSQQRFLKVSIHAEDLIKLAVWTFEKKEASRPGVCLVSPKSEISVQICVLGFYELGTLKPDMRKYELLHFVWNLGVSPQVFLGLASTLLFLTFLSLAAFFLQGHHAVVGGVAWFLLASCYSLLVPPFQAPDEPDHFLTYALQSGDKILGDQALVLAQRDHFESIKFHPDAKFTSSETIRPENVGWAPHISPVDMKSRSPLTSALWDLEASILKGWTVSETLLALRLLNSFIVGLGFFVCLTLLSDIKETKAILAVLLFAMPTLPFFAMHVSNYFTTLAILFVQLGLFTLILKKRSLTLLHYFMIGSMLAWSLVSSSTSVGFLAVWLPILPWIIPSKTMKQTCLRLLLFALGLGFAGFWFFTRDSFVTLTWNLDAIEWFQRFYGINKLGFGLSFILFWVVGTSLPLFYLKPILKRHQEKASRLGAVFALIWLVLILLLCSVGLFHDFGMLPNIEDAQFYLRPLPYAWKSLKASWLALTPTHVDRLFSSSFWFGFGWLESYPRDAVIVMIRSLYSIGYTALLWSLFEDVWIRKKPFDWMVCIFLLALLGMLAGLAASTSYLGMNLHGRYLIGYYVLMALAAALGWEALLKRGKPVNRIRNVSFILSLLILHGFSFCFLLDRYFAD